MFEMHVLIERQREEDLKKQMNVKANAALKKKMFLISKNRPSRNVVQWLGEC